MKLRLHDNSLRLRLTQPEVTRLQQTGRVDDTVTFAPGHTLSYSIEAVAALQVTATFDDGRIRVLVPTAEANSWIDSDQVGIEHSGPTLDILIEKDFQCLHRPVEENPGAYPNPLAK
jgi:hypothetical protein